MGHNDKTIDLADTFNLMSYDSNHSWWDKLWDYGFRGLRQAVIIKTSRLSMK